jgi:hypothetical protein
MNSTNEIILPERPDFSLKTSENPYLEKEQTTQWSNNDVQNMHIKLKIE